MSKYPFKTVASTVTKMSNADFLTKVAELAPQFKEIASKVAKEGFTESNFEAMSQLPTGQDNVSNFYSIACLVGMQFVDYAGFKNKVDEIGVIERLAMPFAEYIQRNRVKRIKNVNPAWKGLKDGDSVDPYIVRKPEIEQDYYGGKNVAYQTFITMQEFDLKRGWLSENGIGEIVGAVFNMIDLDRAEFDYGLYKEALNGAINSSNHPLQGSQKFELAAPTSTVANFTAATFTKAELVELVEDLIDIGEAIESNVTLTTFNAAKYPMPLNTSDLVMMIRPGYKAKIRTMLADVYHDENLKIPFDMKVVENFGGLVPYDSDNAELQPVYDSLGAMVGYVKKSYTNVSAATYDATNDKYTVKYGAQQGSTADVTPESGVDHYVDPNEKVIAVLAQKGLIFELIQNPFNVRPIFNPRGEYTNTFFNQLDNYLGVNYSKALITISRQQAE